MPVTVGRLIVLFLFLFTTGLYAAPEGTVKGSMKIDGKKRTYLVHLPKGYYLSNDEMPLLIAIHGRLGTGKQMIESSGFNDIADREKFIVVYPDGLDRSWADGRGETPSDKNGINDVKFISELIDALADKYRVDTSRVYAMGHSNGGAMTNRLGFDISTKLAGIAPVGANVSAEMVKNFTSEKHIPVLFINGTEDEFIPFDGGPGKSTEYPYPPVTDIFNKWVEFNGCSNITTDTVDKKDDGTKAVHITYTGCGYAPVKMIKIIGGGHSYPGGTSQLPQWILGRYTEEVNASEEIWRFFEGNTK